MPPLKIFILAGQSNMCGMGSVTHLHQLIDAASDQPNEYRDKLWETETSAFRVRDDVYIKNESVHGKLTVAPGYAAKNCFGPELMFGWTVGDALEENGFNKILLIKTAWGGKSLAMDFRPPSSGMPPGDNPPDPSRVGAFYRKMIQEVKDVVANLAAIVPEYSDEEGYTLDGLAWFQGWNDMLNWSTVNEYGTNLANLIRDVRNDLETPNMPFVIGELGQHGPAEQLDRSKRWVPRVLAFRKHQYEVTQMDEFRGNTIYVKTAEFMVFGQETFNKEYHYNGRADTFYHIGEALSVGMLELMEGQPNSKLVSR